MGCRFSTLSTLSFSRFGRPQQSKKNDKDLANPWSPEEEIALCKAWVDVSENSAQGNAKRAKGFLTQVVEYFMMKMFKRFDLWDKRGQRKKALSSGARSRSLATGDQDLVNALLNKWSHVASPLFSQGQDSSSEYLRIKVRELKLERLKMEKEEIMEQMRLTQQGELEKQRIAHERQQLEFKRARCEWKKQAKKEKYVILHA
ncbi:hypothetical protein Tco_1525888 [Tanacetum coccineum]